MEGGGDDIGPETPPPIAEVVYLKKEDDPNAWHAKKIRRQISYMFENDRSAFPDVFHVVSAGHEAPLQFVQETKSRTIAPVREEYLHHTIIDRSYSHICLDFGEKWAVEMDDAKKILHLWAASTARRIVRPPAVVFEDDPLLAYQRLCFAQPQPSCVPPQALENLLSFTEPVGRSFLLAWIGSLFDSSSDRSQVPYLYGDGDNGKTLLGSILSKLFGKAFVSRNAPTESTLRWLLGTIEHARVVSFADIKNHTFITSSDFKEITGGDMVSIERKGKDAYSANLNCKLILASNHAPQTSRSRADLRRVVPVMMGKVPELDPTLKSRLLSSACLKEIVAYCLWCYQEVKGRDGRIHTPGLDVLSEKSADDSNDLFHATFETYFLPSPPGELLSSTEQVTGPVLLKICRNERWTNQTLHNFTEWLATQYGVRKERTNRGKLGRKTVYQGIRTKNLQIN